MKNNGFYFRRMALETGRLSRDSQREYPRDVFPFGSEEIELFAHQCEDTWHVTEKKTGCRVGSGEDMDAAIKDANRVIDTCGKDKFVESIKDTFKKLNEGLEYDYQRKEWIDPDAKLLVQEVDGGPDD